MTLCQKDKLAILGTAGSLPQAPYGDESFEMWGVSPVVTYDTCKRCDVLFEMHKKGYWTRKDVLERLQKVTVPIYMFEEYEEVPKSMRYPKELIDKYRRYHTTSITYMLQLALHSFLETGKPFHVALFGIAMEHEEEYTEQRPCCEYWLGRMEGAGIDVFVAPGGALLQSNGLYGYENYHPVCYDLKSRIAGLKAGEDMYLNQAHQAELNAAKQEGACIEANYWLRQFQKGQVPREGD